MNPTSSILSPPTITYVHSSHEIPTHVAEASTVIPLPLDVVLAPRPLPGRTVTRTGLRTSRAPRAAPRMPYMPLIGGWY